MIAENETCTTQKAKCFRWELFRLNESEGGVVNNVSGMSRRLVLLLLSAVSGAQH